MTKADIIDEISRTSGIDKGTAMSVVNLFMDCIQSSMVDGDNVYLRGFGSFIVKHRAEKIARNILKGTTIKVPAHNVPAFKPCKSFQKSIAAKSLK